MVTLKKTKLYKQLQNLEFGAVCEDVECQIAAAYINAKTEFQAILQ